MNRVILTGRITIDPELKQTQGNNPLDYVRFNLAVQRRGKKDEADFISCQAWKKTAELICKYVKKGDKIGIEGNIRTGSYDKDGQKIYTTDVIIDSVEFFPKEKKEEKKDDIPEGFAQVDEDMPF